MTKQIKAFVDAINIVSEQGKWADETWNELMEKEALAEQPTNEDCSLVQEPLLGWEHFDKAYQKAFTSSQPKDWMYAALMAQQVRNLQATPPNETQEPNLETKIKELEVENHALGLIIDNEDKELADKIAELTAKLDNAREIIFRISQWDALDIPDSDGAYWKRKLNNALQELDK